MTNSNKVTQSLGIKFPIFCGAMYPCSNPELVAAASNAGGIGIIQPLSLVYVYGYEFRAGLKYLRTLTSKPLGVNLLVEQSSRVYLDRMKKFLDTALEEGIRFFVTALGNSKWVVEKARAVGGITYHDVTERKWALKALDYGVDGLICVNRLAGGHAGRLSPEELYNDLQNLNVPLVCAGGVGNRSDYEKVMNLGYQAVQMGTRFIATHECAASDKYKQAILNAKAKDIVLTERLTGVPVAVIETPYVKTLGTKAGWLAKYLLKRPRFKHWARLYYSVLSFVRLKASIKKPNPYKDYWQAGKSVESIHALLTVQNVFDEITKP